MHHYLPRARALYIVHRTKIFWLMTGVVAILYLLVAGLSLATEPLSFDDGWVLQAPLNLAQNGTYASLGAMYGGQDKIFDPYLSTGPSVLLPIAATFKVFGAGVGQARLVMMIFYVSALCLIAWYVYIQTKSAYAILAPLLLLLLVSSTINFRLNILGEMPAIAYGLASLIAWRKGKYGLAGALAALAVLSKVVMFFMLFAGAGVFCMWLVRHWRAKGPILQQASRWAAGAAGPLVAWELFKLVRLGSVEAYKHNWHEYINIFKVGGSGLAQNGTVLSLGDKAYMLGAALALPTISLIVVGMGSLILLYLARDNLRSAVRVNTYGLIFMALYALWWFGLANGGFVRYVVPLMGISIAVVLALAIGEHKQLRKRKKHEHLLYSGLMLVLVIVISLGVYQNYLPLQTPFSSPTLRQQEDVAHKVVASTPTKLTHLGWWQNPEIAFLGDLHTAPESLRQPGERYQLLLSPIMQAIAPSDYQKGIDRCTHVYFEEAGYVYCEAEKPAG